MELQHIIIVLLHFYNQLSNQPGVFSLHHTLSFNATVLVFSEEILTKVEKAKRTIFLSLTAKNTGKDEGV